MHSKVKSMISYTLGGKDGRKINLKIAENLVAVRTKENIKLKNAALSPHAKNLSKELRPLVAFPEANLSVYECENCLNNSPKKARNAVRKTLNNEDAIRFAGRTLVDNNEDIHIYTENIFVKFKDYLSVAECEALIKKCKLTIFQSLKYAKNAYFLKAKEGIGLEVFNIANRLLELETVECCHPEIIRRKLHKKIHPNQWPLKKTLVRGNEVDAHVDLLKAWEYTKGEGVVIAVIDDGIDISHPEFSSKGKIVGAIDIENNIEDPSPKRSGEGHGTACAGIACADGTGNKKDKDKDSASGVAPNAQLMPIRLGVSLGSFKEAAAFEWAADHGADIITCSWGAPDRDWKAHHQAACDMPLPDITRMAIKYALENGRKGKGCIIVWAAGNGNEDINTDGYANNPDVICVSACNDRGKISVYSDYGENIMCCFPSSDFRCVRLNNPTPLTPGVWTTDNLSGFGNGYTFDFGGTSASAPGVAGIIALMLSYNPALSEEEIREVIKNCSDKIDLNKGQYDVNGHSQYYGYGRLNAYKALAYLEQYALSKN